MACYHRLETRYQVEPCPEGRVVEAVKARVLEALMATAEWAACLRI